MSIWLKRVVLCLIAIFSAFAPICAEDWPCWRGPRLDGTSREKGIPVHWSADQNIAWKTAVPGLGHSSPIICNDRVFVTTCIIEEKERLLLCYDARTGKEKWRQVVLRAPLERKHALNSFASSTPATDGKLVFVTFLGQKNVHVAAYDFDGNKVWATSPGTFNSVHGFCSSPIIYKDKIIMNCDQDAQGYIVALEAATGKECWRILRPNRTRSYCVPIIVEAAGKKQLVLSGSKCVASYDPDNGDQHWIIDGPTEQFVASLVYTSGVFFLTAGFPTYHNMAILPDGSGNVTKTHVLWHEDKVSARKAAYVPSPIAHENLFFVVSDTGYATCFDARTGRRHWFEQLGRHHSSSPVSAGGRLYFLDDDGTTHVVKASRQFEVEARNPLGEACYSSPAISDGRIYIRSEHHLWCIGARSDQGIGTNR